MRRLIGVLLAFAITPTVALAATTWKTHTARAAGFSVAAPNTWIDVTRLTPEVLAKVNEIPSLRAYVDLAKKSKAVKLILVDAGTTTVKNHYATNMNIVEVPAVADLQLLRDVSVAQLKSSGVVVGSVSSSYVTLPAGKAVKVQYRARYTATTPVVALVQYLLLHNGTSVVLTYTTLPGLRSLYAPTFTRSVNSFRFL